MAISPFFYFSWYALWIRYGARCVHFTVPSGRRDALFYLREQMHTFRNKFIKKIYTFFYHYFAMPSLLLNWKNTNKELNCVMLTVLVIWRSSTLKFQFVFGFKECLWAIFSLITFGKYLVLDLSWDCLTWLLIFWHRWLQAISYLSCPWIKNLNAKTTK